MFRSIHTAFAFSIAFASIAQADVPNVVADIAPLQSIAARIMQGVGTPDVLLPPGSDPHHYAMRPSEARMLQNADIVLMTSDALTPWLEGALDNLAGGVLRLEMAQMQGAQLLDITDWDAEEGHDDHDNEGDVHMHDEEHDEHSDDPHLWLNPENAMIFALELAETLATIDPEHADAYLANAQGFSQELSAMITQTEARMALLAGQEHVVNHDAFAYFEVRFGQRALGAVTNSHAARPGAEHLKEMQRLVAEHDIACVLAEPGYVPGLLSVVFEGRPYKIVVADPLGGSHAPGPDLYGAVLEEIAFALESCAG